MPSLLLSTALATPPLLDHLDDLLQRRPAPDQIADDLPRLGVEVADQFQEAGPMVGHGEGMAAQVTITPSASFVVPGQTFTLQIASDAQNTFAATMELAFDDTRVAYVSGATLPPWVIFVKNSPPSDNPTVFDVEAPTADNGSIYDVAVLTFQVLANAANGPTGIVINDDGGNVSGWFDADTFEPIPVSYTQADVQVVPLPATAWLLATGIAGLGGRRWLRRKISS